MLDSLVLEDYVDKQAGLQSPGVAEKSVLDSCSPESKATFGVHYWSVDDVTGWLKENLPFDNDRLQEFLRAFQIEEIDGLRFLALQRPNLACYGIRDSEWQLLCSARERLLANAGSCTVSSVCYREKTPPSSDTNGTHLVEDASRSNYRSARLHSSKSLRVYRPNRKPSLVKSSLKFLSLSSRRLWSSPSNKHEQRNPTGGKILSLQEEMVTVEERESALKAKVNHLDEILRTAQMASYLYTRVRWSLSPSELPVDNGGIDDWHQKFIVLEGSSIYFYPRATDLSPEGAILFNEVVDVGPTTGQIHGDEESLTWFGFHITTCHGFHLECATMLKMQAELWVSLIQSAWMDQKGH